MIYKTLKKVSDVCQLFIPDDTHTVAGVTITNNGDGSLTIDGTGMGSGNYTNFTSLGKNNMPYKISDKLFISAYVISGTCSMLFAGFSQSGNPTITFTNASEGTYYSGNISKKDEYASVDALGFFVGNNTFNNFRVKFNIINLTEMYGAGNEPTTVEQFRQDFPEELYDYKPYCFVKSYKNCLTCTTKNLFDISKVTETNELKVIGNSIYSYYYPAICDDTSTLSIFKSLKPNTNYTISAFCPFYLGAATNWISLVFNNGDTIVVFENYKIGFAQKTFSLTQEQINNITYVYFYGRDESSGGPIIWRNIQLEEGSTATEYQPYGYIQSRKKSLICTTKNLWTCDKTMSHAIYNSGTQVFKVINTGSESCYTLPTPIPSGTAVTITVHCLSGYTKDVVIIGGYHNETGNTSWQCDCNLPMNIDLSGKSFSQTVITTNTLTDFWIFVYGLVPNNLQFKVQLELGDTATEYHPYGYL